MSDETPPKPRVEYPTRASLRGRAPAPMTRPTAVVPPSPDEATATTPSGLPLRTPGSSAAGTSPGELPLPATRPAAARTPAGGQKLPGRSARARPAAAVTSTSTSTSSEPDDGPRQHPARNLPRAAAVIVALIGLALVAAGGLQGTVFKPPATTSASLGKAPDQPIVVAPPGMLSLAGPRAQVTATSTSSTPVFLGIGRANDVQAYLANVSRVSLTGEDGAGALTSRTLGSQASLPDPGSADVWVVSVRGTGEATLTWPDVGGQWVLVAATDGKAAGPADLTFTWSGAKPRTSGAALIAIGAVFLVCGVVVLIMLISRSRLESSEAGP